MVFSSSIFLFVFLPFTIIGYYLLDKRFKNVFLLIVSLLFYAWGEPRFVFIMLISIIVNYVFGLLVIRGTPQGCYQHAMLTFMVAFNLSIFFIFKYLNFTISNINRLAGRELLTQTQIVLPIGISFFTFQAMSYVFDVYHKRGEVQKNPLDVALYVAFFPQLIAGPIVRYETIAKEIHNRKETLMDFAVGIQRFAIGLSKKAILSNSVALIADKAFHCVAYSELSVVSAWLGAIAYTFQIYFDFSGYSDMAIGLGMMFGFHFNENFDYPYISKSVSEFWRRWHISLGTWFRDYVYIPLGGSRVRSRSRKVFNLFAVWFLTGFWHGAAWHFVAWGMFYFVLITIEKTFDFPFRLKTKPQRYLYQGITTILVIIGWVIFRAEGMRSAGAYLGSMFGLMGNAVIDTTAVYTLQMNGWLLLLSSVCATPFVKNLFEYINCLKWIKPAFCVVMLLTAVAFTVTSTYNPFIYFNF